MIRIWLDHWFSTAYNIICLLKEADRDFYIIGSNEKELSPIRAACDEWFVEPALQGSEYVDFCLDFAKEHAVDVFIPHRDAPGISRQMDLFEQAGIRVMLEQYEIMDVLGHKDRAYELFRQKNIGIVPEHYIVEDADAFLAAYTTLMERYSAVCFKFVHDEGGKSYRLIDNTRKGYDALFKRQNTRLTLDAALDALRERDTFAPIIVMPYLPGDEVSVDCLMTDAGLIAIPRIKGHTRIEKIRYDAQILDYCADLYSKISLKQPCNIQFKYLEDTAYILEVNTRMSGGVQLSCVATGVNIPGIAAHALLGIQQPWHLEQIPQDVCHVELPLVL